MALVDGWLHPALHSMFTDNYVEVTKTINSDIHANQAHSLWDYHDANILTHGMLTTKTKTGKINRASCERVLQCGRGTRSPPDFG